jgi:hypothetical protein
MEDSLSLSGSPSDLRYESYLSRYREHEESISVSKAAFQRSFTAALPTQPATPKPQEKESEFYIPKSPQSLKSPPIEFPYVPAIEPYTAFNPAESPLQRFDRKSAFRLADLDSDS